jgi:DNA-directed RNA polymerase subunit RPC12/RpoP
MVIFRCPTCGARLQHPRSGERTACPKCGQRIIVTGPPLPKPATGAATVFGSWEKDAPPVRVQSTVPAPPLSGKPVAIPVHQPTQGGGTPATEDGESDLDSKPAGFHAGDDRSDTFP